MTTRLIPLDPSRHEEWAALFASFGDELIHGSGLETVPADTSAAAFAAYLEHCLGEEDPWREPAPGRVHCAYRWIEEDGELVGVISLRLALTPFLFERGGHVGYAVAPHARRRGIATRALALMVAEARERGVDPVLVTCDEDNVASRRTIEASGGVHDGTVEGMRRYWIGDGPRPTGPTA